MGRGGDRKKKVKVGWAVVPSAGFGTRSLPASKAIPKELFPIVDRPAIHLIARECQLSGIKNIYFIISVRKEIVFNYFKKDGKLENFLKKRRKLGLLSAWRELNIKPFKAYQHEPRGLGHALLSVKTKVDSPFAVLLPDDIYLAKGKPAIAHLVDAFQELYPCLAVLLVKKVKKDEVSRYGVIDGKQVKKGLWEVKGVVEKPSPAEAPSNLAIVGRYVFDTRIFEWIEKEEPDKTGEIQLAGAIGNASREGEKVFAVEVDGEWIDIGSPEGFASANCYFLKKRELLDKLTL